MCTFYKRVVELSAEKGVSGSRVCLDLGLSKSTLSDIKSGRKKGVSAETAQKFASYFGVTVGYLLGEEEKSPPSEPQLTEGERTLLNLFRQVPREQQEMVLQMIRAALGK